MTGNEDAHQDTHRTHAGHPRVFATPHGNLAGVYYAKTLAARTGRRRGNIRLFVSDESCKQIVPDSDIFTLEQRMGYSAYSNIHSNVMGMQGLMPTGVNDQRAVESGAASVHGWLTFKDR